jgi:hypothetical protein
LITIILILIEILKTQQHLRLNLFIVTELMNLIVNSLNKTTILMLLFIIQQQKHDLNLFGIYLYLNKKLSLLGRQVNWYSRIPVSGRSYLVQNASGSAIPSQVEQTFSPFPKQVKPSPFILYFIANTKYFFIFLHSSLSRNLLQFRTNL